MNTKNTDGYIFEGAFPSIFCWTVVDIQAMLDSGGHSSKNAQPRNI